MSKKLLSLISILFLVGILSISCSNENKTGSSNSSGTGDSGTGGTTPQGIEKYAGTWKLTPTTENATITISNDGSVTFDNETSKEITDKGNETYEVKFTPANEGESILTLTFTGDTSGIFTLSGTISVNGTITKQQQ